MQVTIEDVEAKLPDEGRVMRGEIVLQAYHTCGHVPDVSPYTREIAEEAGLDGYIETGQTGYLVTCEQSEVETVRAFSYTVDEPVYAVYWETGFQLGSFNDAYDLVDWLPGGPDVVECGESFEADVELEDCIV